MSLRFMYSKSCPTLYFLHNLSTDKLLTVGGLIGTKEISEVLLGGFKFLKNLTFLFFPPQTSYFDPWDSQVSYSFWHNKHNLGHWQTSRIFLVCFYYLLPNWLLTQKNHGGSFHSMDLWVRKDFLIMPKSIFAYWIYVNATYSIRYCWIYILHSLYISAQRVYINT